MVQALQGTVSHYLSIDELYHPKKDNVSYSLIIGYKKKERAEALPSDACQCLQTADAFWPDDDVVAVFHLRQPAVREQLLGHLLGTRQCCGCSVCLFENNEVSVPLVVEGDAGKTKLLLDSGQWPYIGDVGCFGFVSLKLKILHIFRI